VKIKRLGRTDFEDRVYRAVMRIPRGEVRSYGWVASRIGKPGACRAVGNALNRNPHIGIVPCHRVVRSDGSAGGFARGAAAKRRMLGSEGVDLSRRWDV
jgi:methylated-DNA-[protein]-cysteine S-methyltransferase